jgi:hypothetical protein
LPTARLTGFHEEPSPTRPSRWASPTRSSRPRWSYVSPPSISSGALGPFLYRRRPPEHAAITENTATGAHFRRLVTALLARWVASPFSLPGALTVDPQCPSHRLTYTSSLESPASAAPSPARYARWPAGARARAVLLAWASQPVPQLGQVGKPRPCAKSSAHYSSLFFQFLNSFFQYKFQKIV